MTNCTYSAKLNIHHLSQCLTRYFRLIKNPHRILMDLWGWKIIPISTRCPSHMDPRPAFLRYANGHTDTLVVMYSIKYAPLPGAIKCSSKCSGFRTRCRLCVCVCVCVCVCGWQVTVHITESTTNRATKSPSTATTGQ